MHRDREVCAWKCQSKGGDKHPSQCVLEGSQIGHRREQFGEALAGSATAWQAAKWPAVLWLQCLGGFAKHFL